MVIRQVMSAALEPKPPAGRTYFEMHAKLDKGKFELSYNVYLLSLQCCTTAKSEDIACA